MTAEIFDLEAERARRAARPPKVMPAVPRQWRLSQRGNPYATVDGYHIVVFKRGRSSAFRIELMALSASGIRSGATKPRRRRGRMRCWRCDSLDGLRGRLDAPSNAWSARRTADPSTRCGSLSTLIGDLHS
jgi:hypothetical protein